MAVHFLNSQGIQAEAHGFKEYASHITGSDEGSYQVLVPTEVLAEAQKKTHRGQSFYSQRNSPFKLPQLFKTRCYLCTDGNGFYSYRFQCGISL